jgi:hypothetical protein
MVDVRNTMKFCTLKDLNRLCNSSRPKCVDLITYANMNDPKFQERISKKTLVFAFSLMITGALLNRLFQNLDLWLSVALGGFILSAVSWLSCYLYLWPDLYETIEKLDKNSEQSHPANPRNAGG